jgi:hypothetical protein
MITSYVLCAIEQQLKQATVTLHTTATPLQNKLVFLLENLAQLPPIYKHILQNDELICKACLIMLVIRYTSPPICFSLSCH